MVRLLSRFSRYGGLTLLLGLLLWCCQSILSHLTVKGLRSSAVINNISAHWDFQLIKPLHEGKVVCLSYFSEDYNAIVYKRISTAPCGYGMLLFSVGPSAKYEPYTYELYNDFYSYDDNSGLCIFYPSVSIYEESTDRFWNAHDKTEQTVPLGDVLTRISTYVNPQADTKSFNHSDPKYRGGDYLVIRKGNFYDTTYYKHLKAEINSWPEHLHEDDILTLLSTLTATA